MTQRIEPPGLMIATVSLRAMGEAIYKARFIFFSALLA